MRLDRTLPVSADRCGNKGFSTSRSSFQRSACPAAWRYTGVVHDGRRFAAGSGVCRLKFSAQARKGASDEGFLFILRLMEQKWDPVLI